QYAAIRRYRYQNEQSSPNGVRQMFDYLDDNFTIESKINVLSNWIFKKGLKNTFTFSNIFNQIGENETTIREGVNPTERPTDEFKNYSYHYTSRSIYFGQFDGLHKLRSKNEKLNYTLGFSSINRNEPDYRRFRTYRTVGSNSDFTLIDPPSSSLFDAARFYSKLKEYTISATANYENQYINFLDTNTEITFKTGIYAENKNRDFNARWISYSYAGDPSKKNEFLRTPLDQIFAPENINALSGFKPSEGTNPSDKYTASNQLGAAYVFASVPYSRFKFNFGVRTEYFNQTLKSATANGPINVNLPNFNVLPSINTAIYFDSAYDKTLLRITYGKTVNRPEFRELAPFVYYDFMYDVNIVGNPDLESATIDNLDMRFETYPSAGESFSFGVFYKRFIKPIESYVQPIGLSQQYYLNNAASAQNYGIEVELRRDFKNRTQNRFFKHLSTIINASYIYSRVDLGADSTLSQDRRRPLQGQSPYIINTSLQYTTDSSWKINVAYNIIGKRIVYVGNNIFPTIYEMPRHSLDITFMREISKTLTLKFGISDVLNYKHQYWQDTNGDGKISYTNDIDQQLMVFRRGQLFNLGLNFKFK
ncbi:MAG: outer membrane beta-barrel protein, partial [Bacteroidetes bacterium]|nr:outer membrane beta-barrel protein [Bacteroidota bacterium]